MIQNITARIDLYVNSFILLRPYRSDFIYSQEIISQIKKLISEALIKDFSNQKLGSDLGHLTKDWSRDWRWIAHHITLDHFNNKKAEAFLNAKKDAIVYKDVFKEDCKACRKLYLKDSDDESNKEPKLFQLSELINNGNNLNPKYFFESEIQELKPVVGASIFGFNKKDKYLYIDCATLSLLRDGYKWDDKLKRFELEHVTKLIGKEPIKFTVEINGHTHDYFV